MLGVWLTIFKLTCCVCGTNPSILVQKQARAHHVGEPQKTQTPLRLARGVVSGTADGKRKKSGGKSERECVRALNQPQSRVSALTACRCQPLAHEEADTKTVLRNVPDIQGRKLALTASCVPHSLDRRGGEPHGMY